jgi:NAD(P)-dependent dehydrogenase (short-subunit alcohol dehydrogenase family)
MTKAVGIVGYRDSGKTTLARALARELAARGFQVTVVKHTSHQIDLAGKDTATLLEVVGQASRRAWWSLSGSCPCLQRVDDDPVQVGLAGPTPHAVDPAPVARAPARAARPAPACPPGQR